MSEASATAQQPYSASTLENAVRARVSMENFYENLLIQDRDRSNRWKKLEMSMEDMGLANDEVGPSRMLSSWWMYGVGFISSLVYPDPILS